MVLMFSTLTLSTVDPIMFILIIVAAASTWHTVYNLKHVLRDISIIGSILLSISKIRTHILIAYYTRRWKGR